MTRPDDIEKGPWATAVEITNLVPNVRGWKAVTSEIARAISTERRKNQQWQTIDSAPKDGTSFISWNGDEADVAKYARTGPCGRGFYHVAHCVSENGGFEALLSPFPELTHWMAFPAKPVDMEDSDGR